MHTNLTYQPQPALCYISKTTALGVTTGQLPAGNMRFKITTPGVMTGNYHVVISCSVNYELDIANRNLLVATPSIVTLNCIFLIYNVPVTTPGAVV